MARILIGNIKGPKGDMGPQGEQGPVGPQGPQGPLPPLVNNALATEAGVSALDAVMGKTLQDQITQNEQDIATLNSKMASKADKSDIADKNQYVLSYNADDWKLLFAVEKGIFYVRVVNINTGNLVYGGKITLTAFE